MAAYSHHRVGSRSSLFNGGGYGEQELPSGSCNYRDLSIGTRAPVCGCQRFYLNTAHFSGQGQDVGLERAWCFCGHHACFHNAFSQQQRVQEQALGASRMAGDMEFDANDGNYTTVQPVIATPQKQATGLGIRPGSQGGSQSINTRVWQALNDFARNQEDGAVSDTTSKLPSTAAHSVVDDARLSPSRIMQDRIQQYRPMGPPVNIPPPSAARPNDDYSATEVATPSVAGTPDFRALASSSSQARTSPAHLQPNWGEAAPMTIDNAAPLAQVNPPTVEQRDDQAASQTSPHETLSDLQNLIRGYGQRLEVLESLSFSHVPVEELQERFELLDGRILDLEQWRAEQERQQISPQPAKASGSKRRRLLGDDTGSFASDGSFDSNAAAHTEAAVLATLAANAETHPRIDALEDRVSDLENASLPSFARPWQVQVVLLPWGRDLRGIWFSAAAATQHSLRSTTQNSEEWSGANSAPKLSFKSSVHGAWTTESIEAWASDAHEWLSPKACGPNGTVFQRLLSRGLVRNISLTTADARNVLDAISTAFDEAPGQAAGIEAEQASRYHGLLESFIPLRKVRKSSRLRFLSPAEMVTSASWTAGFLDSSVLMKVNDGQRRLYVTTPEAYIQPSKDGLTWPDLRQLPLVDASDDEQAAQIKNTAIEACWTYNDNLDQPSSVHSSFGSHGSQWSTRSQLADPDVEKSQDQPLSPQSEARVPRQRTMSLPSSASLTGQMKESLPKRRVASFETAGTAPVYADEAGVEIIAKRRRISTSPEAERRGVNFTPRWSREPPSPFTSEAAGEARSQGTSSRNKRGNTPFAYATPHSNSNYIGRVDLFPGDGDTEADTDVRGEHSDRGEEEWQGVEDGNTNLDGEGSDDVDIEENDLGEAI